MLGSIARPHGTRGAVLVRLRNLKAEDIKKRDHIFVDVDGLLVPFFIEEFKPATADTAIIKLEDVNSENEARHYSGCEVYISPSLLKKRKKESSSISPVNGYKVIDKRLGFIGTAGAMTGLSTNPLLEIINEGKQWLIPVHEDLIMEIKHIEKEIIIDAPEGLFNL